MKTKFHSFGAAAALVAVSGLTYAAVDGMTIKRQAKEGQTIKLHIKATFSVGGQTAVFDGVQQEKVTKVNADGSFAQEESQLEGKATVQGTELDVPPTPPSTVTYNADGSVKQIAGSTPEATGANAYRMSNLEIIIDPGHGVSVGDTWSFDIKADKNTGAVAAKADFKVLGQEVVGTTNTIKIQRTVKESTGAQAASTDGTIWVDPTDGNLIKEDEKMTNVPLPGAPEPVSATLTATRVP